MIDELLIKIYHIHTPVKKRDIIKDLEENIYCRISRSPIEGVGVFAIRKIPKGVQPLVTFADVDVVPVPEKEIMGNKKIPAAVKEMVRSFYATRDGVIYCSAHGFNEIDISYFLNHSDKPNLDVKEINEETVFTANRAIKPGEELTVNYKEFSDVV
jgi:SET domain-containing protein